MDDIRELYQEMIIDHSRRPRNFRELGEGAARADGYNPLCGDRVRVFVEMDGDRIREVAFKGSGCAISTASASLMTESVKGKAREEAEALFARFQALVTGQGPEGNGDLGKLSVFAGVQDYPTRVKCAVLAWHALKEAISGRRETVSTE